MAESTENEWKLRKRIENFVTSRNDLLTKLKGKGRLRCGIDYNVDGCREAYSLFASNVPPLEVGLKIPIAKKKSQIFQALSVGDIIIGKVVAKRPFGIFVRILNMEFGRNVDFEETEIQAMCHKSELLDDYSLREHADAIDDYEINDIVRGVISLVSVEEERIAVSFLSVKVPAEYGNITLGIVEEADFVIKRQISFDEDRDYNDYLENDVGFANPANVETLINVLGIDTQGLTSFLHTSCIRDDQNDVERLRKRQSLKWSMSTTAEGVECFKSGDCVKAKKLFDHALKICDENAEALVARGALLANQSNFDDSIKDFRSALVINAKHNNANEYLKETLFAKGMRLKKIGNLKEAILTFQEVLSLDANHDESRAYVQELQDEIAKNRQLDEKRKMSASSGSEINRPDRVRKLIEFIKVDPAVSRSERKKKRKKRKKRHKIKKKTKKRTRSRSSSDDETTSMTSGTSSGADEWVEKHHSGKQDKILKEQAGSVRNTKDSTERTPVARASGDSDDMGNAKEHGGRTDNVFERKRYSGNQKELGNAERSRNARSRSSSMGENGKMDESRKGNRRPSGDDMSNRRRCRDDLYRSVERSGERGNDRQRDEDNRSRLDSNKTRSRQTILRSGSSSESPERGRTMRNSRSSDCLGKSDINRTRSRRTSSVNSSSESPERGRTRKNSSRDYCERLSQDRIKNRRASSSSPERGRPPVRTKASRSNNREMGHGRQ